MRILLVEPPITRHDVGTGVLALPEPLALECIAAPLDKHDVRIFDMRLEKGSLERELLDFQPDIVGAGGCTVAVRGIKELMNRVKAFKSEILTVVGGHHATLVPDDFYDPNIDVVVRGEGEETFKSLVDAHAAGQSYEDLPGLALPRDGRLRMNPEAPLLDLDTQPIPARHLVEKYRSQYFRGQWTSLASMYTSRGCPYRCTFCAMWKVNRGKYRRRAPEHIVEELKQIPQTYIDLLDDNTFDDVKWAWRLYELIKDSGIRKFYKAYARSDTIAKHPDLFKAWSEIGLQIALVGFEAFKDSRLDDFNKNSSTARNEEAIEILKSAGVEMAAYFVVAPDFVHEDFVALRDYVDKWELLHPIFTMLTPFPGTDFYETVREQVKDRSYELFDFAHVILPTKLPKKEFYKEYVDLYKYAYSFRRGLKYRNRRKAFGFSWKQLQVGRKFFAQMRQLQREAL